MIHPFDSDPAERPLGGATSGGASGGGAESGAPEQPYLAPPRPLPLEAALDPASPGAAPLLDMAHFGGQAHEMTNSQIRDVRAMLLRDHFAFSYLIAGNKDLYPPVHGPISQLVEQWGAEDRRRIMIQVFRGSFKTSHGTIASCLWQVCRNPNTTIAVFNEKVERVERWFLALQSIVVSNPLFQTIFPEIIPPGLSRQDRIRGKTLSKSWKWSSREMNFNRSDWTLKEPTLTALGVGAASAGGHYQWCILDDIISEEARRSPVVMQGAREWLDTAKYLGPTEATWNALINCTRWAFNDVYEYAQHNQGFSVYKRAAIEDGMSSWQERYPLESLLKDQARNPVSFSCQMLNQPIVASESAFKPEWLRPVQLMADDYDGDPVIVISDEMYVPTASVLQNERPPKRVRLADCSKVLLVDPAPSSDGDRRQNPTARTAMVLKARDPWGRRFKLDVWAGREDPIPEVIRMFKMMQKWGCDRVAVEVVNFSKLYKSIIDLIGERDFNGWKPRHIPLTPKGRDKGTRIAGKRGDYEGGFEYHLSQLDTQWREEYLAYPTPGFTLDLLDAESYDKDIGVLPRPETEQEIAESDYWNHPDSKSQLGGDLITGY